MTEIMDCILANYFLCSFEYVTISSPANEYTPSILHIFSNRVYITVNGNILVYSWFFLSDISYRIIFLVFGITA